MIWMKFGKKFLIVKKCCKGLKRVIKCCMKASSFLKGDDMYGNPFIVVMSQLFWCNITESLQNVKLNITRQVCLAERPPDTWEHTTVSSHACVKFSATSSLEFFLVDTIFIYVMDTKTQASGSILLLLFSIDILIWLMIFFAQK